MNAGKSVLLRFACVTLAALLGARVPPAHSTPETRAAVTPPCYCPGDSGVQEQVDAPTDAADEQAAADQYVANLKALLEQQIVPALRTGIVARAASRPRSLAVEMTEDPSPYHVAAKLDPDGSLKVRLTLGYATMHDAALDAVMLSAPLHRLPSLRPYLTYQLATARENDAHRARGEPTRHAVTFGEFAGIEPDMIRALYAQHEWRASRDRVEVESLGWMVAYLLVRADPKLGGALSFPTSPEGAAAARLAAASDWFPVPPFATAFQLADVLRTPERTWDGRELLCRAAVFMESGIGALDVDPRWHARLQQDGSLRGRLAAIRSDIAGMRRDGGCRSTHTTKGHDLA